MKPIRKVVIPVAGWGTRSLPATKNVPKEMLPVFNKPVIQHVVEEARAAGITDVVFVTIRDKSGHVRKANVCTRCMKAGKVERA